MDVTLERRSYYLYFGLPPQLKADQKLRISNVGDTLLVV